MCYHVTLHPGVHKGRVIINNGRQSCTGVVNLNADCNLAGKDEECRELYPDFYIESGGSHACCSPAVTAEAVEVVGTLPGKDRRAFKAALYASTKDMRKCDAMSDERLAAVFLEWCRRWTPGADEAEPRQVDPLATELEEDEYGFYYHLCEEGTQPEGYRILCTGQLWFSEENEAAEWTRMHSPKSTDEGQSSEST